MPVLVSKSQGESDKEEDDEDDTGPPLPTEHKTYTNAFMLLMTSEVNQKQALSSLPVCILFGACPESTRERKRQSSSTLRVSLAKRARSI